MRVYFKTLFGQLLPIEGIEGHHDVEKLKILGYALYGFVPEETRFIHQGKCVYEGYTLSHFGVKE